MREFTQLFEDSRCDSVATEMGVQRLGGSGTAHRPSITRISFALCTMDMKAFLFVFETGSLYNVALAVPKLIV